MAVAHAVSNRAYYPGKRIRMTKTKLGVALAAASATVLAGCIDSTGPEGPDFNCTLSNTPSMTITGDTVTAANGLKYIEIAAGDSASTQVRNTNTVTVCYVGFLTNGTIFDRGSLAFVPAGSDIITGFSQGVIGMHGGGSRRVIIPPELGYGSQPRYDQQGNIVIPANSTIIFDVGIMDIR